MHFPYEKKPEYLDKIHEFCHKVWQSLATYDEVSDSRIGIIDLSDGGSCYDDWTTQASLVLGLG